MMAQENIETLNGYGVKRIITACPHCLNALKHEYPQMGGNYEVIHHSVFVDHLVKQGKISLQPSLSGGVTYHDPCYLGRYNAIVEQPRSVLRSATRGVFKELERTGTESFCCGAGGGRMWMEETIGKRINLERSEEIARQRVGNVAVGCPFCLTMIEDGMKEMGKEDEIRTLDIAEIVERSLL
jgi:Fe-S oxidoreductase